MPFESQLHSFRYAVLPLLRLHQRHKMHLSLSLSSQSFSLGTVVVFMRYNDTSINRQVFPGALLAVLRERSVREALVAALMMYVHIVGYRNVNACASVPLHRQALHGILPSHNLVKDLEDSQLQKRWKHLSNLKLKMETGDVCTMSNLQKKNTSLVSHF